MGDEEKAILALRGFASAASMIIPSYHLWLAALHADDNSSISSSDYPRLILHTYMREAMLDQLLVQLRRLYDPDKNSLAGGTISSLLKKAMVHNWLVARAKEVSHSTLSFDANLTENHLTFIQEHCSLCLVNKAEALQNNAPRLQVQALLVRRAANKRSAHMTLDDYALTQSDLRDVCFHTLLIARAIQRVYGDDVYSGNYVHVDSGSYEAAAQVFGNGHSKGLLTSSLEENLDMLIERIRVKLELE